MSTGQSVYARMTKLAWRNVYRNWRHSLATILAIASGFMAVSLFDGFLQELKSRNTDGFSTRGMLGHVIVEKHDAAKNSADDPWAYSLNAQAQRFLDGFFAKDPDFVRRVRFLNMSGLVNAGPDNAVFVGYGYDVKDGLALRGERWGWDTVNGLPLHLSSEKSAIIIGQGLGRLLGCESTYKGPPFILKDGNYKPENRPFTCKYPRITLSATTEAAQVNALDLPVVGIFDAGFREADKRAVHVDLAVAQRLLDTDKVSMVTVQLKDTSRTSAFIDRLQHAAHAAGLNLDVVPWDHHPISAYIQGGMQILRVFRNLFMTIVVIICVMSVANTMMKAVNERIREIGTLRSLGFLRRHLVYMFALEGMFLSAVACALGLVLTLIISALVAQLGLTFRAGVLSTPIWLKIQAAPVAWIASATALSLLATGTSWFCSRRASRMVIADAMRHV